MAGYAGDPPAVTGANLSNLGTNRNTSTRLGKPIAEKRRSVSYNATTSDTILSISNSVSASASESIPQAIEIINDGNVPIHIMLGYRSYTADADSDAADYLHVALNPGESFIPPIKSVISSAGDSSIMLGTALDNAIPDAAKYLTASLDIDNATAAGIIGSSSSTTLYIQQFTDASDHGVNKFRVGDLIRVTNEIMEVTALGDGSDLANTYLTVRRGVYGSTAASDHSDGDDILLPFFNMYNDFDRYSVAQTNSDGRFKSTNFFGHARATTGNQGLVPGSIAIKFFNQGAYQELGLSGITSSTNSGLAASTAYEFDIAVDGGTEFSNLTFTTDSTNLNFGGANGIISKIQSALNTEYYTAGNLFEKRVYVGIVDGDIRFTSGSNLSSSAIALGVGSTGTAEFFGSGRIPAIGTSAGNPRIPEPVASHLPLDSVYNRVTNTASPNTSQFLYDDGRGNLLGIGGGTINYDSGAIDIWGCPPNAEMRVSALHSSAMSGALNESKTGRINSLVEVKANTPCQKCSGSVKVKVYE